MSGGKAKEKAKDRFLALLEMTDNVPFDALRVNGLGFVAGYMEEIRKGYMSTHCVPQIL